MTDDEILSALRDRLAGIEAHVKDPPPRTVQDVVPVGRVQRGSIHRGGFASALVALAVIVVAGVALLPNLPSVGPVAPSASSSAHALTTPGGAPSVQPTPGPTLTPPGPDLLVHGIHVRCGDVDLDTCQGVASRTITQFGRGAGPDGGVVVRARAGCPPVRRWVDPTRCWEADAKRDGTTYCLVLALGAGEAGVGFGGMYLQVGGAMVTSGRATTGNEPPIDPSCPPVPASVALDPEAPTKGPGPPCSTHHVFVDSMVADLEFLARTSDAIVVGTVTAVGRGRWSGEGGVPPEDPNFTNRVVTLYRVEVDRVVRGSAPSELIAFVSGGQAGCHTYSWSDVTIPEAGRRYAIFLNAQDRIAGVEGVYSTYELGEVVDNAVTLRDIGSVALDDFVVRTRDNLSDPAPSPRGPELIPSPAPSP